MSKFTLKIVGPIEQRSEMLSAFERAREVMNITPENTEFSNEHGTLSLEVSGDIPSFSADQNSHLEWHAGERAMTVHNEMSGKYNVGFYGDTLILQAA